MNLAIPELKNIATVLRTIRFFTDKVSYAFLNLKIFKKFCIFEVCILCKTQWTNAIHYVFISLLKIVGLGVTDV